MNEDHDFPLLSEFLGGLNDFTEDVATQTGHMEQLQVRLPLECRVAVPAEGRPSIHVAPPRRTETSIGTVLHTLSIKVTCDG